jgi:hypothetical protein
MHSTTAEDVQKLKRPKQHGNELEKKLMIDNLKLAVEYYGKDYMRKIFKIRKHTIIHDYTRH